MSTGYANEINRINLKRYQMIVEILNDMHESHIDYPLEELTQRGLQDHYSEAEMIKGGGRFFAMYEKIYIEREFAFEMQDKKITPSPDMVEIAKNQLGFKED